MMLYPPRYVFKLKKDVEKVIKFIYLLLIYATSFCISIILAHAHLYDEDISIKYLYTENLSESDTFNQ